MQYTELNRTLSTLLTEHHQHLDTRAILIDVGAIPAGVSLLQTHLPRPHTVAGRRGRAHLGGGGLERSLKRWMRARSPGSATTCPRPREQKLPDVRRRRGRGV